MATNLHAGMLDRRIVVERQLEVRNAYNEVVQSWIPVGGCWARVRDTSTQERLRSQEIDAEITTRFTVRYNPFTVQITPRDRILYKDRVYNITGTREPEGTRKQFIEIDASARNDTLVQHEGSS